jgi:hypothetical protein
MERSKPMSGESLRVMIVRGVSTVTSVRSGGSSSAPQPSSKPSRADRLEAAARVRRRAPPAPALAPDARFAAPREARPGASAASARLFRLLRARDSGGAGSPSGRDRVPVGSKRMAMGTSPGGKLAHGAGRTENKSGTKWQAGLDSRGGPLHSLSAMITVLVRAERGVEALAVTLAALFQGLRRAWSRTRWCWWTSGRTRWPGLADAAGATLVVAPEARRDGGPAHRRPAPVALVPFGRRRPGSRAGPGRSGSS